MSAKAKANKNKPDPNKKKKAVDAGAIKLMKDLLKDYEARTELYETTVCIPLKKALKKGIDEERALTKFIIDPQDRRLVEYWEDDKFIKHFSGEVEERPQSGKKRKAKQRQQKEDKPLVKLLPLIESIRAKRYLNVHDIYVWDVHVEDCDMFALAGLLSRSVYQIYRIELIDCFIDSKSLSTFAPSVPFSKTLRDLVLDFNGFGDKGCRILCNALRGCKWLVHLSLCFCELGKQSGLFLGNLISETPIREVFLDGNYLESEGTIALISQLAVAAENEAFERQEEIRLREEANQALLSSAPRYNINNSEPSNEAQPSSLPTPVAAPSMPNTDANPPRKKGKKGGAKFNEPPPSGPQISILKLADNGINHMGRGGNFAPVRCMQLLKSIIAHSQSLQELDLFGNEVGDLGARYLLEGLLLRRDNRMSQIGLRMPHRINQDTYDIITKLAPGFKKKGRGGGGGGGGKK